MEGEAIRANSEEGEAIRASSEEGEQRTEGEVKRRSDEKSEPIYKNVFLYVKVTFFVRK